MPTSLRDSFRRAPLGLVGMLVLVGLFEGFIAAHNLRFSRIEADDWRDSGKIAREALPPGGILFFGDSQVKFGMMPLLVEAKLGQPAQCLAVQGGQAPASYFLLKRALEAGTVPAAIVVDFEPNLLRDGVDHNRRMWSELVDFNETLELVSDTKDLQQFGSITLGSVLPSYRERYEIRDNLMAAFKGITPPWPAFLEMSKRNRGMNRGALAMAKQPPNRPLNIDRWGNPTPRPWSADPVNDLYVRKFLRLAMARHIPVYCALMPVLPQVQAKYEMNGMDEHYFAWLRVLQKNFSNLYVLDWRHSNYDHTVLTDELHLDHEGSAAVTNALGDYLQKAFQGQDIDKRWVKMPDFRREPRVIAIEDSERSYQFMQSINASKRLR